MKVSTPPSYTQLFNIYNAGGTLGQYSIPPHRGLLVSSSTASLSGITIENVDGTTGTLGVGIGTNVIPIVIKKMTIASALTGVRISGLL